MLWSSFSALFITVHVAVDVNFVTIILGDASTFLPAPTSLWLHRHFPTPPTNDVTLEEARHHQDPAVM